MAETEPKGRRRGRPPLSEAARKRHTLSFRLTSETKERLEHRAALNGRSLSEEAEWIITSDIFTDIPFLNYLDDELDYINKSNYNNTIEKINSCNEFQNLISRFLSKLIDLESHGMDVELYPYFRAFYQIIQLSRSKTQEIEWLAIQERNNLMLEIYEELRSKSTVSSEEIKKLYENRDIQLRDYMLSVLRELGVKSVD